jgi:hypothetical protein
MLATHAIGGTIGKLLTVLMLNFFVLLISVL